ncbi:MAG TPA: hypothetical protein VFG59_17020 [Anaeromyxobacter sp.]|nr:hypothetical protein [Anaeromyxobacter sp.]
MPNERKGRTRAKEAPRTDLPPTRKPYYPGYFGTGEEEKVRGEEEVRRERIPRDAAEKRTPKGENL